jgi:hypothetical protein
MYVTCLFGRFSKKIRIIFILDNYRKSAVIFFKQKMRLNFNHFQKHITSFEFMISCTGDNIDLANECFTNKLWKQMEFSRT